MDWVHCNLCFVQPGTPENHRFLITTCGHIYCSECAKKVPREKCQICERPFETTELNSEMKGEILEYFQDPMDLFNKAVCVANFQQGHRSRFVSRLRSSHLKYVGLKAEAMKLAKENHNLQKKIKHNELELGWYKNQLRTFKQKLNERNRLSSHPELSEYGDSPATSDLRHPGDTPPNASQYFFTNPPKSQAQPSATTFLNTPRYRSDPTYSSQSSDFASPFPRNGIPTPLSAQRSSGYSSRPDLNVSGNNRRQSESLSAGQARFNTPSGFSTPGLLRHMSLSERAQLWMENAQPELAT